MKANAVQKGKEDLKAAFWPFDLKGFIPEYE